MLITKECEVKWNSRNKKHFVEKCYSFTKMGDTFLAKLEDMNKGSNSLIRYECDFCQEIVERSYKSYFYHKEKNPTNNHLDCCQKCVYRKNEIQWIEKYGVSSYTQLDSYKESKHIGIERARKEFSDRGYLLLEKEYVYSNVKLEFMCPLHKEEGSQFLSWTQFNRGFGCRYCSYDRVAESMKGENNPMWKDGITNLIFWTRGLLHRWINDSLRDNDYKCELTNETEKVIVHHKYPFRLILSETMEDLNLEVRQNISEYSPEELDSIKKCLLRMHYEKGLGACLREDLHKLFHSIYSYRDFCEKDYEDFKCRFNKGEFDEALKERAA